MLLTHLNQQLHSRAQQGLMRQRRTVLGMDGAQAQLMHGAQAQLMHGAQAQLMHGAQAQLMGSAQAQLPNENGATQIAPATQSALCFASNDYLGLSQHPDIIQALQDGAAQYGAGSGASHLVSGHSLAHAALEAALLDWLHPSVPDAAVITMGSGYMANMALLTALGYSGDTTLFTDKLNHASLIDAAQLARAHVQRYPHNHTQRLGQLLASSTASIKLIVTDAVFSMDGDTAPLPELLALAEQHDAWLVLDDAHGLGIWGAAGQGTAAHYGLCSQRLIIMGTFGKALGTAGACVLAHRTIINWLVQTARPYIYTTACPPAISHATTASVALLRSSVGDQRRAQLQANITQWRTGMAHLLAQHPQCGWQLLPSETAIQPVLIGDNQRTATLGQRLLDAGMWVGAIRPPTVPVGTARLRITLSAAHSAADIQALLDALGREAGRANNLS